MAQSIQAQSIEVDAIRVSNATELMNALANAQGGETILLAAGDYGSLNLNPHHHAFIQYADTVTIRSEDVANKASFSELSLHSVSNVTIDNVIMDYVFEAGDLRYEKPFQISNSENITVSNSVIDGDVATDVDPQVDGYGTGYGLTIRGSENVAVEAVEITNFHRGILASESSNLRIVDSEFHGLSSDGLDFAAVQGVLVENNHIHDFLKPEQSGAHLDMIQFWTAGTDVPSTDVIIRGNVLHAGEGVWTQSIFMRNEVVDQALAGEEMYYRNITIENNVIYNAHLHGITLGEADGVRIANNTLMHSTETWDAGPVSVPTISMNAASRNVVVEDNVVPSPLVVANASHVYDSNVVVQNANSGGDNYYGDVFVNGLAGADAALSDLAIVPDADMAGVGAALSHFDATPEDGYSGYIVHSVGDGLASTSVGFDADRVFGANGQIDLANATAVWDFGDGRGAAGLTAAHTFEHGGVYDVSVTVSFGDGESIELNKVVTVASPLLVDIAADSALVDMSDYGNEVTTTPEVTLEAQADGDAIRLNDGLLAIAGTPQMIGNDEYSFGFDFQTEIGDQSRHMLARQSGSFYVSLGHDFIMVGVSAADGRTSWLKTGDLGLADGEWHSFALTFSGKTGLASIYADGVLEAQVSGFAGAVQDASRSPNILIGDPHQAIQYEGLLDNIVMVNHAVDVAAIGSLAAFEPPLPTQQPAVQSPAVDQAPPIDLEPDVELQPRPDDGEQPPVDEQPVVEKTPIEEPPVDQQAADEEPPVEDQDPLADGTPVVQPPVVEDTPVVQPPVVEDTPAVQPPVVEDTPVVEPPVVEDTPAVQPPVVEDTPVVEPPVVEDTPVVEPPVVEDTPVVQPPVVEDTPVVEPPVVEKEPADAPKQPQKVMFGNGRDNVVIGDDDNGVAIKSGGGNDRVVGGKGADMLNGQGDDDQLEGGDGVDMLIGRQGDDLLIGGAGGDLMYGGLGADTYVVDDADDVIRETGVDIDKVESFINYSLNGRLENLELKGDANLKGRGNGKDNQLIGNDADNALLGGGGNDEIFGGKGADVLIGHGGDDRLIGGEGVDRINGGGGADVIVMNDGDGYDIVYRFQDGVDMIDLTDFNIAGAAELEAMIHATTRGAEVHMGDGDVIRLVGFNADLLDANDFII